MASPMPANEPLVLRDADDGIVTLTLNRPRQYNVLSRDMLEVLQGELDDLAEAPEIRVVIVAAAGSAFCAGHDLKQMRAIQDRAEHQVLFAQCSRMMLSLQQLPQPVIAQVNGIATAAGCQLVAACDLAVAAISALSRRGIGLGDTVAVMLPNIPEMVEAHFGAPMTGAVLNALNIRLDADAIAFMLRHGNARVLIADREFAPVIGAALAQLEQPPLLVEVLDPTYTGPGERLGDLDYEAFIGQGDPQHDWQLPRTNGRPSR